MVGFEDVVQILGLPVLSVFRALAFGPQRYQGSSIGRCLISVDYRRFLPVLQAVQRLVQEGLCRCGVPGRRKRSRWWCRACRLRAAPLSAQSPLDFRRILLDPTVDRGVVHVDAALGHYLLQVAIGDPVPAVPTDSPEHDLISKMPILEIRHGPSPGHSAACGQALQQAGHVISGGR